MFLPLCLSNSTSCEGISMKLLERWAALFAHVRRLPPGDAAHDVLQATVEAMTRGTPSRGWRRKPRRPHHTWIRQITQECRLRASELWTTAGDWSDYVRVEGATVPYWLRVEWEERERERERERSRVVWWSRETDSKAQEEIELFLIIDN